MEQGQKAEWFELCKLDNDFEKYIMTQSYQKMVREEETPGKRL